jgi:hypothetical protein
VDIADWLPDSEGMKAGLQDPGLPLSANRRYSSSIWLYITWSGNGSHTAAFCIGASIWLLEGLLQHDLITRVMKARKRVRNKRVSRGGRRSPGGQSAAL